MPPQPDAPRHNLIGQRIGPYRLLAAAGQGTWRRMFRARNEQTGGDVALKVILAGLDADPRRAETRRRMEQLTGLTHPNIAPVLDAGAWDFGHYLAMPWLDGDDLRQTLLRTVEWPFAGLETVFTDLSAGLTAAHAAGVVHQNIKPSNIILNADGHACLVDFPILPENPPDAAPYYTAPETFWGQTKPAPAADVYSLGAILFEMLTGTPPFVADSGWGVIQKHQTAPIPNPRDLNPDLPAALTGVVQTALAKDPAHRFASVGEMADALSAARRGQAMSFTGASSAAPPPDAPTTILSLSDAAPKPRRRLAWLGWGGGVAVVLVAIAVALNLPAIVSPKTPSPTAIAHTPEPTPGFTPSATLAAMRPVAPSATATIAPPTDMPAPAPTDTPRPSATATIAPPTETPSPTPTLTPSATVLPTPTGTPSAAEMLAALRGKILFKTNRAGQVEIYQMNGDGSEQKPLAPEWAFLYNEAVRWEAFSPDRTEAITVRGAGQFDLWRVQAAQHIETRLTTHAAADYDPVWSPDGGRVVFVSDRSGHGDLYLLPLDGSANPQQLTENADFDKHPSWSPDGTHVAFWSNHGPGHRQQIWRINVSNRAAINLSNNDFDDWDPVWVK